MSLSLTAFASETRFDPDFEKKCFKEIETLKCGKREDTEKFKKCVDSKLPKLSKDCQEMHKAYRSEAHDHDH